MIEKIEKPITPLELNNKVNEIIDGLGNAGKELFDIVQKDHILSYEETEGYELLGNYVYKEALAGSRYGYPDFYNKVIEEYNASTSKRFKKYKSSNIVNNGAMLRNGVLSAFSGSQYATIPNNWSFSSPWTFKTKIKLTELGKGTVFLGNSRTSGYSSIYLGVNESNKLALSLSANGSSWGIASSLTGSTVLNANQDYHVKLSWDGSTYKLQLSTDDIVYTDEITKASTSSVYAISNLFTLGWYGNSDGAYFRGEIDLNETYIDENGQRFWNGCNYYEFDYFEHTNGHKFYNINDYKDAVDDLFNDCGSAWFYGVDTLNERVLLPRCDYVELTTKDKISVIGNGNALGLKSNNGVEDVYLGIHNIGNNSTRHFLVNGVSASNVSGVSLNTTTAIGNNDTSIGISTDAEKSGLETDLTGFESEKYYYMVVGNVKTTEGYSEVVAQGKEILEQVNEGLAGKANTDLSNVETVSQSFKDKSINWNIPDYTAPVTLVDPAVAPSAGLIIFGVQIPSDKSITLTINGAATTYSASYAELLYLPFNVSEGDTFSCSKTDASYTFYPFKGVN